LEQARGKPFVSGRDHWRFGAGGRVVSVRRRGTPLPYQVAGVFFRFSGVFLFFFAPILDFPAFFSFGAKPPSHGIFLDFGFFGVGVWRPL